MRIFVSMVLLGISFSSFGATYYSRVSGTFGTKGNWSPTEFSQTTNNSNLQPTDVFVILNGHTMTLGAAITTAGITVRSGGTLALATFVLATGTGNVDNSGTISGSSGGISRSTGVFTNTATGSVSMSAAATFTMGTGDFVNNNTNANVNFGSGAITVSGTAQLIGGFTTTGVFSATNASGTITLAGNVNAGGLTMNASGILNLGPSLTHTITGAWTRTSGTLQGGSSTLKIGGAISGAGGTFAAETGTVEFNGSGAQTIPALTYNNLKISNAGAKTIDATVSVKYIELATGPTLNLTSGQLNIIP